MCCLNDIDYIEGSGKEGGSELEVKPEVVEMKHTPLDSPSDIPQEKVEAE